MQDIIAYLKKYFKEHFHFGLYLSTVVFVATCTYLNYQFNIEKGFIQSYRGSHFRWVLMFLEMGLPFLGICSLMYIFRINTSWIKSKEFWLLFFFSFVIISFNRSFHYHYHLLNELDHFDAIYYRKVFWRLKPTLVVLVPILAFYYFYERQRDSALEWYGLVTKNTDFRPYAILTLVVFFGIWVASYISELSEYYPRYAKVGGAGYADAHGFNEWVVMLIYELSYGASFVSVELFFRGLLVMGFARVLGGHAVLAMVGSYVALHYGKPVTETISSAFGGYILGILSFYSRRIWGGVVLHVALAWSMEFFAWLQNSWDN